VSIPLTVTVTGGSSGGGGGGWFGSNGSFPYTPPNWASIFPSMNQPQSSSPVDNRPVATNPPELTPPVLPQSQHQEVIPYVPVKEEAKVDWFLILCLGAIALAGIIIVIILVGRKY